MVGQLEEVVGVTGLEPATSRSRTVRSTSLSYTPVFNMRWNGRSPLARLGSLTHRREIATKPVRISRRCNDRALGLAAHRADGLAIVGGREDTRSGHQDFSAGLRHARRRVLNFDPAIDLDEER